MANPQLKNGYTRIANDILCHLIWVNLSAYETRILLYIVRKTYGYGKKEDLIPLSQFAKDCRIRKSLVCRTLKSLSKKRMIIRRDNNQGSIYTIQKNWEQWPLSKEITTVICRDNKSLSVESTSKDNTKENISKEIRLQATGEIVDKSVKRKQISYPMALYRQLNDTYAHLKGIQPQGKEWDPIMQTWKTMLMSGRTPEEIIEFMHWLSNANQRWTQNWTHKTVMLKLAEYLGGKLTESFNEITRDPMFKRLQEVYLASEGGEWNLKMSLLERLGSKYPKFKYEKEWQEANKILKQTTAEKKPIVNFPIFENFKKEFNKSHVIN